MDMPENAMNILRQEQRLKSYKMHLEEALNFFNQVRDQIPSSMQPMFKHHVAKTAQNFQPGLTTLAWNSMNIGMYYQHISRNICVYFF